MIVVPWSPDSKNKVVDGMHSGVEKLVAKSEMFLMERVSFPII